MPGMVLDTHATIWYLESSPRLSKAAAQAIKAAIAAGEPVHISTITVVELTYLVEKGRFPTSLLDLLLSQLRLPESGLLVAPLDLGTAEVLRTVPGNVVRDMPDRIITATAVALGLPLVTKDASIKQSGVTTIW